MKFITDAQLREWLAGLLAQNQRLIAPVQVQDDLLLYQPVTAVDRIAFNFSRSTVSPKEYFLPAADTILTIERLRQAAPAGADAAAANAPAHWDLRLAEPAGEGPAVLFGVRACDAHALLALDALLLQDPVDAPYAQRRAATTLVGLACAEMGGSCFCTSMGYTPDDTNGLDVTLIPVAGGYVVADEMTAKGEAALAGAALADYSGADPRHEWPAAAYTLPPRQVWEQAFNDPYWGQLADRCLSCKICAYVCPTCRCFDVRDAVVAQGPGYQKIERLRCWDSCMAEGYRRIAGGHNPRAAKSQRLRNRFFCKFDYYKADFGTDACVGCGRCIESCPTNVDITEVLTDIAARAGNQPVID